MAAEPQSGRAREADAIAQVAARLRTQFPEVPAADIDALVHGRYSDLDGSKIRDFVPVLVERGVREELTKRPPGHRA